MRYNHAILQYCVAFAFAQSCFTMPQIDIISSHYENPRNFVYVWIDSEMRSSYESLRRVNRMSDNNNWIHIDSRSHNLMCSFVLNIWDSVNVLFCLFFERFCLRRDAFFILCLLCTNFIRCQLSNVIDSKNNIREILINFYLFASICALFGSRIEMKKYSMEYGC